VDVFCTARTHDAQSFRDVADMTVDLYINESTAETEPPPFSPGWVISLEPFDGTGRMDEHETIAMVLRPEDHGGVHFTMSTKSARELAANLIEFADRVDAKATSSPADPAIMELPDPNAGQRN
jgi:hypothetical protein